MKNTFSFLQRVGRAFMLPIAVLPMAGILLGVGGAFTSNAIVETYGLTFLAPGTMMNHILTLFLQAGLFVFANLSVIFAVGVAIGLANKNKETAALSALLGFLLFHTVIGTVLGFLGQTAENTTVQSLIEAGLSYETAVGKAALYTKELGIFTLQTGVLGGIICGALAAFITNRFSEKTLSDYLAFFSGNRFVPVLTMIFFIPLGVIVPFVWPSIFGGVVRAGEAFTAMGPFGTFLYGLTGRLLNVFGLHHAVYPLFWYTELGGTMEVAGKLIAGGQKIFFAQLADPTTIHYSANATRTMTGGFLPMMFGLPAAALAMYHCADMENRTKIKGILISAALTSFLTGITEPIEFTFLFVAPPLYLLHALLEGLSYGLMHFLNVAVGITFSRGIIDFTFFGLLQGMAKTSYQWILILAPFYAGIYYFLFKFMIEKFDYPTPGRKEADTKLYTRKEYTAKENEEALIDKIVNALGGAENIEGIDACITRLRVTVRDEKKVAEDSVWKNLQAQGVLRAGKGIQIIYGTQAEIYKNKIIQKYSL
ncbi:PTS sugar transporter subunit IIABC [Fusobacterium necrophorum]|uniref:PTS transporter subunit EIIC n=1 Tax=Fusobacterium necrophorum TaxID=859 RepID=UPI001011D79E|nr:PTS transporter subunit EIIC [Fusobacterium necrophorum]RXZ28756.1 PTS sugar transporter subunit IIABC [Fusobacterium necrophorum]